LKPFNKDPNLKLKFLVFFTQANIVFQNK
jgi:hypothetical protein